MPDQYGRKTLDEAIAAAYQVRYRAEEDARHQVMVSPSAPNEQMLPMSTVEDLEAAAGFMGWIFGLLTGAVLAFAFWMAWMILRSL